MDLHQCAAARGQSRAAGLRLAAVDRHQDPGQTPREQCPCPGTPRENQTLGSAKNHYAHGTVPSSTVGLGAAVSPPRKGQLAGIMPRFASLQGSINLFGSSKSCFNAPDE